MTRHAKASSAGSILGQGSRQGSFGFPLLLCLCIGALLALSASSALGAETHPYTGTSFGPDGVGGTESFEGVRSLAVDPANGDTYVYDAAAAKIYKFDSAGAPLNFSATGTNAISGVGGSAGGAEFEIALVPAGSPAGTAGDIYVANNGNAIHVYSAAGAELPPEIPQGGETCGVATDPSGNLYAGVYSKTINKFTPSANPPVETDKTGTGIVEQGICNVAADGLGNVYAANYNGNGLYKLEGIGDTTPALIDSAANTMAIAPGSNDLYADNGNEVFQYDSSGTPIGSFGAGDISDSHGVAINSGATKIYAGTPTKVKVFGPATTVPDAITEAADAITKTTATLHGKVGAAGGPDATCVFQYTSASAFFAHGFEGASEEPCSPAGPFSGSGTTSVTAGATGLSKETEYRFRLVASSSAGSNAGPALSFQTPGAVNVLTNPATNITESAATLNGTVNPEGIELEECAFEYRSESGFFEKVPCAESPAAIGSGNTPVAVHLDLTGLVGGTKYRFYLVAKNKLGTNHGVEESFKAKGPSVGSKSSVSGLTETAATFHAKINPNGVDTSYVFEYVTQADFEATGFAGATSIPAGGESIGAGAGDVEVSATAEGLQPRTSYRFRVVATSADGITRGAATAFGTWGAAPVFGSCPNDRFRTGPSAKLPDCRAYEQVTPNDKSGSDVSGNGSGVEASSSGDGVTFYTLAGFPGSEGFQNVNILFSHFTGGDWSTAGLNTPPSYGDKSDVLAWTPDLRLSFVQAYSYAEGGEGSKLVMRDSADGSREVLIPQGVGFTGGNTFTLGGAFDDDSKVVFEAYGAVPVTSGPTATATERGNIYLYDRDSGELTLAGLLPDSACASPPCVPAEGSRFPSELNNSLTAGYVQDEHVVSPNGDIYFTDPATGQMYLRRDAAGDGAATVLVSASRKTNGGGPGGVATNASQPVGFQGAIPDGSTAFFTSNEELTNDANTGPEPFLTPAIGRANSDGSSVQHSFIPTTAKWTAVDSAHVYWTNTEAGTIGRADIGGANPEPNFITGLENPEGIAVDSSYIYWAEARDHEEGDGTIGRSTLAGASIEKEFIAGASDPRGVAVNSEDIYWTNGATSQIGRSTLAGASPEQSFHYLENGWGIAVNASNIYAIEVGQYASIREYTLDGAFAGQESLGEHTEARALAIDSNHLYWSDTGKARIGRLDLDFGNANPKFITSVYSVFGVAIDAGHVYWATNPSTSDRPPTAGNDLYRYDVSSGEITDVVTDSANPDGAEVLGVFDYSSDGSRIYFAANGDLDSSGPAQSGDCTQSNSAGLTFSGSCSLYLWQDDGVGTCTTVGGCIVFIAPLDAEGDGYNWGAGGAEVMKTSRVSADGRILVFRSRLQLTGDETPGATQFYRYDAESGQIVCVTCSPTGVSSGQGNPDLKNPDMFHAPTSRPAFFFQSFLSRNLSPDGNRFFFQSTDQLVPADVNGEVSCREEQVKLGVGPSCRDVYEWEAPGTPGGSCATNSGAYSPTNGGCLYLLSTGTGIYPSYLADVSKSGDTAFIFSRQKLVPSDEDTQEDIYAVKVDGGLLSQNTPRPANCEGDACRRSSSQPPNAPGAGSGVFEGPSNPKQSTNKTRCPKGKKTVHSKGKTRCVAKKHKKKAHKHKSKAHKRAANNDRRASR